MSEMGESLAAARTVPLVGWRTTPATGALLPAPIAVALAGALAASMFTPNPLLTAAAVVVLWLLVRMLWRPREPAVLLFAFGCQWAQISFKTLLADYRGTPLAEMTVLRSLESAIWLSYAGLLVLAFGASIALRQWRHGARARHKRAADPALFSIDRVFIAYAITTAFAVVEDALRWRMFSLAQVLDGVALLHWACFYLLAYLTLKRRTKLVYLAAAGAVEFVMGIGFFADFKLVVFVVLLAIASVGVRLTFKRAFLGGIGLVALFMFGLAWTSIKGDYRTYLNRGSGQQVVLVSPQERLVTFLVMMSNLRSSDLTAQIDALLTRVAYVDFFASAIDYVPAHHDRSDGRLLAAAVTHALVPRFLYPSKANLPNDSELTREFTGLRVASTAEGTSIGMGYFAELYVDIGEYLLLPVLFLLGLLWGRLFHGLVDTAPDTHVGYALGTALFINANQFEIALSKLLGGMLMKFFVLVALAWLVGPWVQRWWQPRRIGKVAR